MITDEWYTCHCIVCGTMMAMAESLKNIKQEKGDSFYCPNGHGMAFTHSKDSEKVEALKNEIIKLKHEIEVLETRVEEGKK